MKYVLMYVNRPELDAAVPAERREAVYASISSWFETHGAAFSNVGAELQSPDTATSVKTAVEPGGKPVVVDGPFSEAKENIGGFSIIDVPDLDAAIELAASWPLLELPGVTVEVRPIVTYPGM
jgi:hypothetical protein